MPRPQIQLDYATRKLKARPHAPHQEEDALLFLLYTGATFAAGLLVAAVVLVIYHLVT